MISQEMLSAYERIIQKRFDHVCAMIDSRFRDEYGESIRVLGVPDDRRAEFAAFVLDELASGVEDAGFDFVGVVPCSWADAKEVFPGIGTREAEEILTRV